MAAYRPFYFYVVEKGSAKKVSDTF